jgi:hypothetical protein
VKNTKLSISIVSRKEVKLRVKKKVRKSDATRQILARVVDGDFASGVSSIVKDGAHWCIYCNIK